MKADQLRALQIYPHVVVKADGERRATVLPVFLSNTPIEARGRPYEFEITSLGLIDATGEITPAAREELLHRASQRALRFGKSVCVVWDERTCTWIEADGTRREGGIPPRGEAMEPNLRMALPFEDERPRSVVLPSPVELPDGTTATHLCVVHFRRDLVEISFGDACVLGDFSEVVREGHVDPAAEMLDDDGNLKPVQRFRGARVTAIRDDWEILGAVQPIGEGIFVRNPTPDDVRAACRQLLRAAPSTELFDQIWEAVDPRTSSSDWVAGQRSAERRMRRVA